MTDRHLLTRMQQVVSRDKYFAAAIHDIAVAVMSDTAPTGDTQRAIEAVHKVAAKIRDEEAQPFYERPMI